MKLGAVIDNAVPARVVRALKAEIIASPPRTDGTHWYALAAPAGLLFEQTIQHLRQFIDGDHIGAEWWFRATTPGVGFPFHFDRDEGIRRSVVSPDLLSILYLSTAGGPTVFLDATPTRTSAPKMGTVVHPRAGRFCVFPGAMLHGVLPVHESRWPRVTMLINWWRTKPHMEPARAQSGWTRASGTWRANPRRAALESIDPTSLMAKAAWRDLIAKQATYR
ncbi:MAG TPA: 2OG-Fe(II) oxygenase [Kofleriaceae bacterium]|jgi:hypothetical protein